MGQYFMLVNLDKREFVNPHVLGAGLKQWEQLANFPGTGAALIVLLSAQKESRGGGDIDPDEYQSGVVGRWAGDRIALVGDYSERSDLPAKDNSDLIFMLCDPEDEIRACAARNELGKNSVRIMKELNSRGAYKDISLDVAAVIENELDGKFKGIGWREWHRKGKSGT
jgi:hypothetical protein